MLDIAAIRKDFPMLENNPDLIYFDNGASTLKPQPVIDAVVDFYARHTSNVHRGDYPIARLNDELYDGTRDIFARFLNCSPQEVAFTHNVSASMNEIIYGAAKAFMKPGDVILTTQNEHASNIMPWFKVQRDFGIKVEYIPTDVQGVVSAEDFEKAMHEGVKAVCVAQQTNVLAAVQPIKEMARIAHEHGALMIVDGAQSVPHMKTDVKDLDIDFLGFSGHKMCGPGGTGVLWGRYELVEKIDPMIYGGDMNARFYADGKMLLQEPPMKFEYGTPNIEGVIGLGAAAEYLMKIGMDNIHAYEKELGDYFRGRMKEIDTITLYNPDSTAGVVTFNVKDVFAQDTANFLATKGIAVRSGNHCAKILDGIIGTNSTVRASLYFYNTFEEVDRFVEAVKEVTLENAVSIFF